MKEMTMVTITKTSVRFQDYAGTIEEPESPLYEGQLDIYEGGLRLDVEIEAHTDEELLDTLNKLAAEISTHLGLP
jgi:hypothetical protein